MLVLSRRKEERVEIGGGFKVGGITITVVDIVGDKVRLGFEATKETSVNRSEVNRRIERTVALKDAEDLLDHLENTGGTQTP